MATESIDFIKQRASQLTPDEKEDLAAYLIEQAKKDRQAAEQGRRQEEPDPYRRREFEWLRRHRDEYAGQYVALDGDRLIAHGEDGKTVYAAARNSGVERPLITRVEAANESWGGWS